MTVFYQEGFHGTGIERILAVAGLSKMTLYRHFKSKDELILAAIEERDRRFNTWIQETVEGATEDPVERLTVVFDALDGWFRGDAWPDDGFRGCMFINASAEFAEPGSEVRRAAARHKQAMIDYLAILADAAGIAEPGLLAKRLALLAEGAIVTAQVSGRQDAARDAKEIAVKLVREALAA